MLLVWSSRHLAGVDGAHYGDKAMFRSMQRPSGISLLNLSIQPTNFVLYIYIMYLNRLNIVAYLVMGALLGRCGEFFQLSGIKTINLWL